MTSPSYTLVNVYQGSPPIYHMDWYRLESASDVLALGLDEYLYHSAITLIEWYERAETLIPDTRIVVKIEVLAGEQRRLRIYADRAFEALISARLKDSCLVFY